MVLQVADFPEHIQNKLHGFLWQKKLPPQTCKLSQFPRETSALEALIYLPLNFYVPVETPYFLDIHTNIFKMTYN